jgi:hypothetical protein
LQRLLRRAELRDPGVGTGGANHVDGLERIRVWQVWPMRRSVALAAFALYGECMARFTSTTVRLDEDDVRALKKARAAGHTASELVRKGLRVVASRYYSGRRPPTTGLFESTDSKLGDESLLFKGLKD